MKLVHYKEEIEVTREELATMAFGNAEREQLVSVVLKKFPASAFFYIVPQKAR